jgi:hypothetical protein
VGIGGEEFGCIIAKLATNFFVTPPRRRLWLGVSPGATPLYASFLRRVDRVRSAADTKQAHLGLMRLSGKCHSDARGRHRSRLKQGITRTFTIR